LHMGLLRPPLSQSKEKDLCETGLFLYLLRGPESNRRLEVLLHLLFPAGMDYTTIP